MPRRYASRRRISNTAPAAGTPPPVVPGPPTSPEWILVMDEQFPGSTYPATWAKAGPNWEVSFGGGNWIRDNMAVTVVNGILTITAQQYTGNLSNGDPVTNRLVTGSAAPNYGAGGGLAPQTYGRYEIRVRTDVCADNVMSGVALLWPDDGIWPQHGELDFYETGGGGGQYPTGSYIHHFGATVGADATYTAHLVDSSGWHTIVMEWRPGNIKLFADGVLSGTVTDRIPSLPMHMVLQFDAYGSTLTGSRKLEFDYVKIWTYVPGGSGVGGGGGSGGGSGGGTAVLDSGVGGDLDPIAGNWTTKGSTGLRRVSNQIAARVAGTYGASYWNAATFAADQEAFVTWAAAPFGGESSLYLRYDTVTGNQYEIWIRDTATAGLWNAQFQKKVSGVDSQIGATVSAVPIVAGDVLKFRAVGSTLTFYVNNVLIGTRTDSSITAGGRLALNADAGTGWRFTNFGGGNYAPIFASDTFSGEASNPWLYNHAGETGATWAIIDGAVGHIVSPAGRVYSDRPDPYADAAWAYASGTPATAEYDVSADVYVASVVSNAESGIAAALSPPARTGYTVAYNPSTGVWTLRKIVADVSTTLGTHTQVITTGTSVTVQLRRRSTGLTVAIGGVDRITTADTAITAVGYAGLRSYGTWSSTTGVHIDNFVATNV